MCITSCKGKKKIVDKPKNDIVEIPNLLFDFLNKEELGEVLELATKENKWVYIDIGAKWCAPCKLMKRDVYTNETTASFFNKNFISYLVDGENGEGPDLRIIFDVKSYPTLLFVDGKGRIKLKKESGLSNTGLMTWAQEAIKLKNEGQ